MFLLRRRTAHCVIALLFVAGPLPASTHRVNVARTRPAGQTTNAPVNTDADPDCGGTCDRSTMLQFEYALK